MSAAPKEPSAGGADAGRGRGIARGVLSLAAVSVFFGSLYFAARGGIELADRQVPPAGVEAPGEVEVGRWWGPKAGAVGALVVADQVQALRDYAFQQSVAEPGRVEGVRELTLAAEGWKIEVLPGGDRRFLRVELAAEGHDGEVFWLRAEDLRALAEPVGG